MTSKINLTYFKTERLQFMTVGTHKMIFRDDDPSYLTTGDSFEQFKQVQDTFDRYNLTHTIALIAKNIELNPALIDYINSKNIDVQLHCWDHMDMTTVEVILYDQLYKGVEAIKKYFKNPPTKLYPPWNKVDDKVRSIAKELGLDCDEEKLSLPQYIRVKGHVSEHTVNFHYWAYDDRFLIDTALEIYKNRRIE